jgi:hypothetical protein
MFRYLKDILAHVSHAVFVYENVTFQSSDCSPPMKRGHSASSLAIEKFVARELGISLQICWVDVCRTEDGWK